MTIPKGYKRVETPEADAFLEAMSQPDGYKKVKRVHDEYNPRPPRSMGLKHMCKCCHRGSHTFVDRICPRCLKDRFDLAVLEQEIAAMIPATAKMPMPAVMRRVWERSLKLEALVKKLKARKSNV